MPPSPEIGYRNQLDSFIILSDKLGTTWEKLDRAVQNRQPESGRALTEKNVNVSTMPRLKTMYDTVSNYVLYNR
jgi:hypothetical protein